MKKIYSTGETGEARTHDPLLKRQVLLPTELQSHIQGTINGA